ncbi:MAG: hypothetical protein QF723_09385, partial [Phycisphaerales bacterium]|nr:hypothetical protein [Phycisphaerales bacterium]
WYLDRLKVKQERDVRYLEDQLDYMRAFLGKETHREEAERLGLVKRLSRVEEELDFARSSDYLAALNGTLGLDCSLAHGSSSESLKEKEMAPEAGLEPAT